MTNPAYDEDTCALNLELAEHAYLQSRGWYWVVVNGCFSWLAPPSHKGSLRHYSSRAHAINSVKRHHPQEHYSLAGRQSDGY